MSKENIFGKEKKKNEEEKSIEEYNPFQQKFIDICSKKFNDKLEILKECIKNKYKEQIFSDLEKHELVIQELKSKDINKMMKCLLYHLFIGSTPEESNIEYFDLEGDDSILEIVKKHLRQEKKQNNLDIDKTDIA